MTDLPPATARTIIAAGLDAGTLDDGILNDTGLIIAALCAISDQLHHLTTQNQKPESRNP